MKPAIFQVMPELTVEEYAALRDDIAGRGVLVPAVVDQHGRVLDGHHRLLAAAELGVECLTVTRVVRDDEEARQVALALNLARRHLTREQKRVLIAAEVDRDPQASDREIGRRLGCSHRTVAAVRRSEEIARRAGDPRVDNLSTRPEAEERTEQIRQGLADFDRGWTELLADGVPPAEVATMVLEVAERGRDRLNDAEVNAAMTVHIVMPRVAAILSYRPAEPEPDQLEDLEAGR